MAVLLKLFGIHLIVLKLLCFDNFDKYGSNLCLGQLFIGNCDVLIFNSSISFSNQCIIVLICLLFLLRNC